MTQIKISDSMWALLQRKHLTDKDLVLIADDGGGKYSLHGGACTIGTQFTLIVLDQPDPDYAVKINNERGLRLWSSAYNLYFFDAGLTLDVQHHSILIKDDAHLLDSAVQIADGPAVLAAFQQGVTAHGETC
ncbi:iron-sulfur cluster biosynthesis family protein [Levilactobacillus spicheri]